MIEIATIPFKDIDSNDDAVVIVRYDEQSVAICLSLRLNGDIEVVMNKADARKFSDAIVKALAATL